MRGPFEGVRVLDFTRFFAGPYGTYQFALLGADVIKIEPVEGEEIRSAQLSEEWVERRMAPAFVAVNANKRCMTLDLRKPEARDIVLRMVRDVDVVWENFRPGIMERFGLGYETLAAANPQMIYCAVSGFGQTGPEARSAAFDGKLQAMSGIMSLTGTPEEGPMRAGFAACDLIGGLTAAFAVSSALYQRKQTGRGQFVDVAMLDATLNMLTQQITEYTMTGHVQRQYGNLSVTRKATADRFRCGNGYIVLAVLLEKQFESLMRVLGRPDVLSDPRFASWPLRSANSAALREIIEGAMREGDPAGWEARLTAADVPCGSILGLDETVNHPQVRHRGQLQTVDSPFGPMTLVGPGFQLAHGGGGVARAPGRIGEHTDEILDEFGFAPSEVERWRQMRVI